MNKLRVGIVVNQHFQPEIGGGYSYYYLLLKAINNYSFPSEIEIFNIIIYDLKKPDTKFEKPSIFIKNGFKSIVKKIFNPKWLTNLQRSPISSYVANVSTGRNERRITKILKSNKIDLLYYLAPEDRILNIPFITTHWDVGHRSTYPFPLLAMNGIYESRENYYTYILNKALFIICESQSGAKELSNYYKFFKDKIKILPIFGGQVINVSVTDQQHARTLEKFGLEQDNFFVYPAQFWPHKNQYTLVKAFDEYLKTSNRKNVKLVLCGSDKGNMSYIYEVIKFLSLDDNVILTGFVSDEELNTFYSHAIALVMPTFLGPTNLPLLEATHLKCPVICSDFEGHRELLNDNALYFNPSDSVSLAQCMAVISDSSVKSKLSENAYENLKRSSFRIENSLNKLSEILLEASVIRKTWGPC